MIINEERGDLFELDKKYVLAHCISQDCAMGKGIAVEFDKRYPGMKNELIEHIRKGNLKYPTSLFYGGVEQAVFNLVTKQKYWGKPTYETIEKCIKEMADTCRDYEIKYLAMPKIGCGLDKLDWYHVKKIIKQEFHDIDIEIEVRYL